MYFRLLLLVSGVRGLGEDKLLKENQTNDFWSGLMFHSNVKNDTFVSKDGNRRGVQQQGSAPQVLMTECPLNYRCVGRNFCDETGLRTTLQSNRLTFSEDKRGLLAYVDTERNLLGVCCTDKLQVINGGRTVRQDDLLEVSEDELVTLDTSPSGLADDFVNVEEEDLEKELTLLDSVENDGTEMTKDPVITISEEDIANAVQSVKEEDGRSPSNITLNNQEDTVRFLQAGQESGSQRGPTVVINIQADSLGLGRQDKDGDIDTSDIKISNTDLTNIVVDESVLKDLNDNDSKAVEEPKEFESDYVPTDLNNSKEVEDPTESESPDYLDFDTNYITITLESDTRDESAFHGGYNVNSYGHHLAYRTGIIGNTYSRNRRPFRQPARYWQPVFRHRSYPYSMFK